MSRKATRQFSKVNRWTGISSLAVAPSPLSLNQSMALGGICLQSAACSAQGAWVPQGQELGKCLTGRISSRDVGQAEHFGAFPTTHQDLAGTVAQRLLGSQKPPQNNVNILFLEMNVRCLSGSSTFPFSTFFFPGHI